MDLTFLTSSCVYRTFNPITRGSIPPTLRIKYLWSWLRMPLLCWSFYKKKLRMSNICDSARGHSSAAAASATLVNEKKGFYLLILFSPYTSYLCSTEWCVVVSPKTDKRHEREVPQTCWFFTKKRTPRDTQIHKRRCAKSVRKNDHLAWLGVVQLSMVSFILSQDVAIFIHFSQGENTRVWHVPKNYLDSNISSLPSL